MERIIGKQTRKVISEHKKCSEQNKKQTNKHKNLESDKMGAILDVESGKVPLRRRHLNLPLNDEKEKKNPAS